MFQLIYFMKNGFKVCQMKLNKNGIETAIVSVSSCGTQMSGTYYFFVILIVSISQQLFYLMNLR